MKHFINQLGRWAADAFAYAFMMGAVWVTAMLAVEAITNPGAWVAYFIIGAAGAKALMERIDAWRDERGGVRRKEGQ